MTAQDDEYDYAAAVIETLREAGGPLSDEQLWDRVMRRPDVPADDREMYSTPPFTPGPYPRNTIKLKLASRLLMHTDGSGTRPDAPLMNTMEGYWLREWGPLPVKEQQRRAEMAEEQARREREPAPPVWPELDPHPKAGLASETELRDVAEKLVRFRSLVSGQRMITVSSSTLSRIAQETLAKENLLDESRRYHTERDRMIST